MPDEPDDEQPQPPPRTYDPNAHTVWPVYPPGTRLPIPEVRRSVKVVWFLTGWVLLPAGIMGIVFAVLYLRHLAGH